MPTVPLVNIALFVFPSLPQSAASLNRSFGLYRFAAGKASKSLGAGIYGIDELCREDGF